MRIHTSSKKLRQMVSLEFILKPWFAILHVFGYGSFREPTTIIQTNRKTRIIQRLLGVCIVLCIAVKNVNTLYMNVTKRAGTAFSTEGFFEVALDIQNSFVVVLGCLYFMLTMQNWWTTVQQLNICFPHYFNDPPMTRMGVVVVSVGSISTLYVLVATVIWDPASVNNGCLPFQTYNCTGDFSSETAVRALDYAVQFCSVINIVAISSARKIIILLGLFIGYCYRKISNSASTCTEKAINSKNLEPCLKEHAVLSEIVRKLDSVLSPMLLGLYAYSALILLDTVKKILDNGTVEVTGTSFEITDFVLRTAALLFVNEQAASLKPALQRILESYDNSEWEKGQYRRLMAHYHRFANDPVAFSLIGIIHINRNFVATMISVIITSTVLMWELEDKNFGPDEMAQMRNIVRQEVRNLTEGLGKFG